MILPRRNVRFSMHREHRARRGHRVGVGFPEGRPLLPFCLRSENGSLLPFFAGRLRRPANNFYHFVARFRPKKATFTIFRGFAGGREAFTILLRF